MTTKKDLRIIFGGTPDFAAEHLKTLISQGYNVVAVYTQPDRESGRGHKLTPSPVKEIAEEYNIPVEQPLNFKQELDVDAFKKHSPDLFVVVAYGVILPKSILNIPTFGCINIHGSLLPKYRGAAPIQRAIFNGEKESGITVMQMNEGLDTGDMLLTSSCNIDISDTSETLFNKLIPIGCKALTDTISLIIDEKLNPIPQNNSIATYASKITKEEAVIDWNESAEKIDRRIRTYNSWPMAKIQLDNLTIKVHKASISKTNSDKKPGTIIAIDKKGILVATGKGSICLEIMQLPGKKAMKATDIINGYGTLFTIGRSLL